MQVHETSAVEALTKAHALHLETSRPWAGQTPNIRDLFQAISLFKNLSDAGSDPACAIRAAYEEVTLYITFRIPIPSLSTLCIIFTARNDEFVCTLDWTGLSMKCKKQLFLLTTQLPLPV